MSLRRWLRRIRSGLVVGLSLFILLLCASPVYAIWGEPNWTEITRVSVPIAALDPAFHGYRIVQLSDIHVDHWMTEARLRAIVAQVNQLQPDVVALTGDFVTRHPEQYAAPLTAALRELQPTDRTVAVLGNHDHWSNAAIVIAALEQAGIQVLSNQVTAVQRGTASLSLAGVDDVWTKHDRLDQVLAQLPDRQPTILLVHEPDFADQSAATGQFDLQLSGHSHGGQVRIPFVGAVKLPPYGQRYPAGRHQIGNLVEYTNRGVGMVKPRVRFNCRPEITLLTLDRAESAVE